MPLAGVYNILNNDSALTSAVGNDGAGDPKIYPVTIDQETAFPAVRFFCVSGDGNNTKGAVSTVDRHRLQVDVYAPRDPSGSVVADDIADKVRAALDNVAAATYGGIKVHGCTYISRRDDYIEELEAYWVSIDFSLSIDRT